MTTSQQPGDAALGRKTASIRPDDARRSATTEGSPHTQSGSELSTTDLSSVVDCCVVGTGPAGLTAALALASKGASVIATGPLYKAAPQRPDTRTIAIFSGGINMLKRLGVWEACSAESQPLKAIRIIDDTGRLLRAPEMLFRAAEIGSEAFGWNVPLATLIPALQDAVTSSQNIEFIATPAVSSIDVAPARPFAEIAPNDEQAVTASLVVGADGRSSMARKAAGIEPLRWDYDQAAIVCSFSHSRPHDSISTEFHRPNGPMTTIPLPGNRSSLVWVENKNRAAQLASLDDDAFARAIEDALAGLLGSISNIGPGAQFPLSGMAARSIASNRIALVGESAHVVPPIGAQGLNLGLRDAAALADAVGDALADDRDPGAEQTLAAYRRLRQTDVITRTAAVDLLNRTLLSSLLPAQALRGMGLHALKAIPALRHLVMREGMQPTRSLPRLMQPIPS